MNDWCWFLRALGLPPGVVTDTTHTHTVPDQLACLSCIHKDLALVVYMRAALNKKKK